MIRNFVLNQTVIAISKKTQLIDTFNAKMDISTAIGVLSHGMVNQNVMKKSTKNFRYGKRIK